MEHKQTYIAMWNLAAFLFEDDLTNAEALELVEACRTAWAESAKFASVDKAKMAGKQLVKMWEAIGGDENIAKASDMREMCGMKKVIVAVSLCQRGRQACRQASGQAVCNQSVGWGLVEWCGVV